MVQGENNSMKRRMAYGMQGKRLLNVNEVEGWRGKW